MAKADNYAALLLEDIREQLKAVLEAVGNMQKHVAYIPAIRVDIEQQKEADVAFKLAIRDISRLVNSHGRRITNLKQA